MNECYLNMLLQNSSVKSKFKEFHGYCDIMFFCWGLNPFDVTSLLKENAYGQRAYKMVNDEMTYEGSKYSKEPPPPTFPSLASTVAYKYILTEHFDGASNVPGGPSPLISRFLG